MSKSVFPIPSAIFTPGAAGAGTIDLSAYSPGMIAGGDPFELARVVAIINQTKGRIIYATASEIQGYTNFDYGTWTMTLQSDTSTMSSSDVLQMIYDNGDVSKVLFDVITPRLDQIEYDLADGVGTSADTAATTHVGLYSSVSMLKGIFKNTYDALNRLPLGVGKKTAAFSFPVTISSDDTLDLQAISTTLGATNETAPATDTATSAINGRLQRIAQRLSSLISLLPSAIGQKTSGASFAVVLSSDQETIISNAAASQASIDTKMSTLNSKDFATSAKQDTGNASVASIDTKMSTLNAKDFATSAKQDLMNAGIGSVSDAAVTNPAVNASMVALLKGLLSQSSASFDSTSTSTVAGTVVTLTPPSGAKLMIVQNSLEAGSPVRFTGSAGTPSTTEGYYLGVGQSTSTLPAGTIKLARTDVSGSGNVSVAWFK